MERASPGPGKCAPVLTKARNGLGTAKALLPGWLSGKAVAVAAQVLVSLALLRYALTDVSVGASLEHLAKLPLWFILLAFGAIICMQFLVVARWWIVLRILGSRLSFWVLLQITFVGFLFNNFMPALVGQDAVRIYYTGRDSSFLGAGISVVFDKALGLLVIAALSCMPLLLPGQPDAELSKASYLCLAVALCLAGGFLVLLAPVEGLIRWTLGGRAWAARIHDALLALVTGFRACITPGVFLVAFGVGFLMLAILTGVYMEYVVQTGAAAPGFWELFGPVAVITLLTSLPISFNGIGVREKAHIVFLAALGLSSNVALGIAIMQYAFVLGLSIIGLGVWMRLRRVKTHAKAGAAPAPDQAGG